MTSVQTLAEQHWHKCPQSYLSQSLSSNERMHTSSQERSFQFWINLIIREFLLTTTFLNNSCFPLIAWWRWKPYSKYISCLQSVIALHITWMLHLWLCLHISSIVLHLKCFIFPWYTWWHLSGHTLMCLYVYKLFSPDNINMLILSNTKGFFSGIFCALSFSYLN